MVCFAPGGVLNDRANGRTALAANVANGEFLAVMSHEMYAPMNAVSVCSA